MANRVVEFRLFRLHHGRREEFAARFKSQLLPLHQRVGIDVVTWGPSLHDLDSFYVVRAHPSVETRQEAMDAMFGSDEWLMNQEEEVLGMIESYNTCVIEACEPLIEAMRTGVMKGIEQDVTPPGWR
ncbi:MAG: NIPSNAP family protein [Pseudomonadota bacterium]|nr:NIPSNAP family protein [Pseudomonadota bacterium]